MEAAELSVGPGRPDLRLRVPVDELGAAAVSLLDGALVCLSHSKFGL